MDTVSEMRLALVYPGLASKVRDMAAQLEAEAIDIRVTQGLRTMEEQNALYAQGRTAPGAIVTNAKYGDSWHCFGLAADVVPLAPQGADWNIHHPVWVRIVAVGMAVGLVSGGTWRSFPDYPHVQLTGRFPVTPNDEARLILNTGGVQAVWRAAFEESGLTTA